MAEITHEEAVALVAGAVRRLFALVPESRARDVAGLVLRELAASGVHLVRKTISEEQ